MKAGMSAFGPRLEQCADAEGQAQVHFHLDLESDPGSTLAGRGCGNSVRPKQLCLHRSLSSDLQSKSLSTSREQTELRVAVLILRG